MRHHVETTRSRHQGFTLIELMIAIALGGMVVYVAFAGFRVASQSISVVNRMAIENALMRSGMQMAHDHLDFWTDCDDPTNLGEQKLRGKDNLGGMPFTPMKDVFPYAPNANPELSTGWNPRETWSAHDPRQWWRGNQAEHDHPTVHIAGRYALFANTKPTATLPAKSGIPLYGTVTVAHSWLYNQTWGMLTALGNYGYVDYMPANMMYSCHAYGDLKPAPYNVLAEGGTPVVFFRGSQFAGQIGYVIAPAGLWRRSTFEFYGVVSPLGGVPSAGRKTYASGYGNGANSSALQKFLNEVDNSKKLLGSGGPATWPDTSVSVRRFVKTARFVSLCTVMWVSPLTGEKSQLVFSGFGTSLRGARQQRHETLPRWAEWDGHANPANDRTLDGAP